MPDVLDRLIAGLLRGQARWPADTDAHAFLARVRLHGVGGLLHASIERTAIDVPAPVREGLRAGAVRAAAVDLACRRELARLLELAAGADVRPLLIKGTPLAYTHYPEPGLRERADADVLVRTGERERLLGLLAEHGYRRADAAGGDLASAEASLSRAGSPLVVDVHWRISSSPLLSGALEFEELTARSVPVPALGPHARAPGVADAALLAAIHRAKHHQSPFYAGGLAHRGDRLIWLYDLHLLAPTLGPGECQALARRAARHGVAGLCLDALRRTQEAFGTAVPPGLLDALERDAARAEPSMVFLRAGRRRLLLAELRAVRGWAGRARWMRQHALPPADYMLRKYATQRRWLLPALYLRRALGWLTR